MSHTKMNAHYCNNYYYRECTLSVSNDPLQSVNHNSDSEDNAKANTEGVYSLLQTSSWEIMGDLSLEISPPPLPPKPAPNL